MKSRPWLMILLLSTCLIVEHSRSYGQETLQDPLPQPSNLATPPPPTWAYPIIESQLTCEQAHLVSKKTVERLGYQVTTFTPATAGKDGELKASRMGLWGEKEPITVVLTCAADEIG